MALKQENRWEARPRLAAALKLAIYLVPFIASAAAARTSQTVLRSTYPDMHWAVAAVLSIPLAALVLTLVGRLMRRLLPLALLLRLSLLFPDQIPDRLGVALRAASTKRLVNRMSDSGERADAAENILALVAALGAHDRRTRGHSERVRALTMLVADEIGLNAEDRDKLEWAALLHDLGKLEVPPEILNKNGRPTDHEWAILREHPSHGPAKAGVLGEWLGEWIHAMDQHHERFDGTGYPLGLSAEDIALSGRIVAVSDAFEVMTATRSYKKPMTTQAARDELVACAGTHFDPAIVRSFMAISIGDIHRVLGPTSWLASIPYIGSVTNGVGTTTAAAMLGGSISPAVAATLAIVLATPTSTSEGPVRPVLAFAEDAAEADAESPTDAFEETADPAADDNVMPSIASDGVFDDQAVLNDHAEFLITSGTAVGVEIDEADEPTVSVPLEVPDQPTEFVPFPVPDLPPLPDLVPDDDGLDVDVPSVLEPLVEETLGAVDDVTNTVVEDTGLDETLEDVGDLLSPLLSDDDEDEDEVEVAGDGLVSDVLDLGGLFGGRR